MRKLTRTIIQSLVFYLIGLPSFGRCAEVLFVKTTPARPAEEETVLRLADFYGITLRVIDLGSGRPNDDLKQLVGPTTIAILASNDALASPDLATVSNRRRADGTKLPILVFGVKADKDNASLEKWTGNRIHGCAKLIRPAGAAGLLVDRASAISGSLAGWKLPAVSFPTCQLRYDLASGVESILFLQQEQEKENDPVLLRNINGPSDQFFIPELKTLDSSWAGDPSALPKAFSSVAPFVFFLNYALGDYAYHFDGQYANLTIDDPWLIEPYGGLNYRALSTEMEAHNFHTTIAFIPWNFDRSKSDVISLFRAQPNRWSIAIHGNNHTHREFGNYTERRLADQSADIRQAVQRMGAFQAATGLPYDRFMIFPHVVAPAETFTELKRNNFQGTANSMNVPANQPFPTDPLFLLRPYTLDYGDYLSIVRYSAETQPDATTIAIQVFLRNPVLFYGHQGMFEKSPKAFNTLADLVNRLQPVTRWTGLGEIARHMYLSRRSSDDAVDVQMFSNEADITNTGDNDLRFRVCRLDRYSPHVQTLTIDGTPIAFKHIGEEIKIEIVVASHGVKKVRLRYEDPKVSAGSLLKGGVYVRGLRWASDFRDLYLSRMPFGDAISRLYYQKGYSAELYLERRWWLVLLLLFGVLMGRKIVKHFIRPIRF